MITQPSSKIVYPESDGEPMANNTLQFDCITIVKGNLELLYANDPNVFVAGDLFWYPVEGHPEIRQAPDTMVVFGRPKGHRGSYLQWLEDNIPPQVVFEIVSPGNRPGEWVTKFLFYQRYGVEEYYIYDPDTGEWEGWRREGEGLMPIEKMEGWESPRLKVRFTKGSGTDMGLLYPDNRPFLSFVELGTLVNQAMQQAEAERQRADAERQRAERLAQRLRELGIEPESE